MSQEFIKLYYKLLNECPDYLHQLYKDDSSAMVSEAQDKGPPCRVQADNIEVKYFFHAKAATGLSELVWQYM